MKSIISLCLLLTVGFQSYAQEVTRSLKHFDRIVVSPKITCVLLKGEESSVTLRYSNVNENEINTPVYNDKLHIFLDDSRFIVKKERRRDGECTLWKDKYHDASVTAYVTYTDIRTVIVRGEQEVISENPITSEKFKLKAYGATEIELASLNTSKFKAKLFGENRLKIREGEIKKQKFKLYGENKVDTKAIESETITTAIYGEANMRVRAKDEMFLTAFGESSIQLSGSAYVSKVFIFGNPNIQRGVQ